MRHWMHVSKLGRNLSQLEQENSQMADVLRLEFLVFFFQAWVRDLPQAVEQGTLVDVLWVRAPLLHLVEAIEGFLRIRGFEHDILLVFVSILVEDLSQFLGLWGGIFRGLEDLHLWPDRFPKPVVIELEYPPNHCR